MILPTYHCMSPRHKNQVVLKSGVQTCHYFDAAATHAAVIAACVNDFEEKWDNLSWDIHSHNDGLNFQLKRSDNALNRNQEWNHLL